MSKCLFAYFRYSLIPLFTVNGSLFRLIRLGLLRRYQVTFFSLEFYIFFYSGQTIRRMGTSSISDQDPKWIRSHMSLGIRIRIQEGKNDPTIKVKKYKKFHVWSAGCSLWGVGRFFCSFKSLQGDLSQTISPSLVSLVPWWGGGGRGLYH
jgi:hypothetical protein